MHDRVLLRAERKSDECCLGNINEKTQETYEMVKQLDEFIGKNKQTAQDINDIISKFRRWTVRRKDFQY